MKHCQHLNFQANVDVARITEGEGGPLKQCVAEITVICADCKTQFSFVGVPRGSREFLPTVAFDGTILYAPLAVGASLPPDGEAIIYQIPQPKKLQ